MHAIDESIDRSEIEQLQALSFLESPPDGILSQYRGEIKQRSGNSCDGDAFHRGPIVTMQAAREVESDAGPASVIAPESCHVDQSRTAPPDSPQPRGSLVAENGLIAASKHSCHGPAQFRDVWMPYGIYASVQWMQPARAETVLNSGPGESQPDELLVRNDTVLPIRELSDRPVTWSRL
jgi:hypothetical protein